MYALVATRSYDVVGNRDCTASSNEVIVNNDWEDSDGNCCGVI